MSKTIEIWHRERGEYKIVSPDREGELYVSGYTLDVDSEALMEDGVQTVDIPNGTFFHVEEDGNHATITVEDEPPEPDTIEISYYSSDVTDPEIVAECARTDVGYEYTGVRIGETEYDLVER